MAGEDSSSYHKGGKKMKMGRKAKEEYTGTGQKVSKHQNASVPQASFVRKQVDPETAKYFAEIANVIEGTEIELEERTVICGNALEEARGKEVELATDYIISHTMQTLLEGCSVDHLCALTSLALHLQEDNETHSLVEEMLSALCQEIVVNPVDIMCNCYGSHVMRRLLYLCEGENLGSSEFHSSKPSVVLAERLNLRSSQLDCHKLQHHQKFPDQLKFLVSEMLNPSRVDIATLVVNQYSSLVLQTALKLLAGHEQELLHVIPVLLGFSTESALEGNFIEAREVKKILSLVEENAYSHLMEVILEVAPDTIYDELFTKVFRGSLFKMSSHHCGNFVVQALVSHARSQDHIMSIWEELGTKFKTLLEMGRPGVVASLLAASQRLQTHEHKCCQALAAAVRLENESTICIVPRILFLDSYFNSEENDSWNWPNGVKMHLLGSLILQSIFRLPNDFILQYISSITSLEDNHVLEASKDPSGARVIEAFLSSNASTKHKRKLVIKLRGHFGELSVHPSGSFTVEKCFNVSNVSLRETIVSEILPVQSALSKTKQGPYLLRKLDVEGFSRNPDQWKSRQVSKQSAYEDFYAAFGPKATKASQSESFLADTHHKSQQEKLKDMRKEIDTRLSYGFAPNSGSQFLAHPGSAKLKRSGNKQAPERAGFAKDVTDNGAFKGKNRRHKMENVSIATKNTKGGEILQDCKPSTVVKEKKRRRKDAF
ncbi:Pumilio23 [Abeliophyllum distichum]|uniref:Pumilio23 n=1 Tax=Abeliophyllum distichum TaxID=126358 RepID=A0ABD1RY37_9LAMI